MAHLLLSVRVFFGRFLFMRAQYVLNAVQEWIIYTRMKIITRHMPRPLAIAVDLDSKVNQTHTRCSDFLLLIFATAKSITLPKTKYKQRAKPHVTMYKHTTAAVGRPAEKWTRNTKLNWLSGQLWMLSAKPVFVERERDWLERKVLGIFRDFMASCLPRSSVSSRANSKLFKVCTCSEEFFFPASSPRFLPTSSLSLSFRARKQ